MDCMSLNIKAVSDERTRQNGDEMKRYIVNWKTADGLTGHGSSLTKKQADAHVEENNRNYPCINHWVHRLSIWELIELKHGNDVYRFNTWVDCYNYPQWRMVEWSEGLIAWMFEYKGGE